MPIYTRFRMMGLSGRVSPSHARAACTCPRISPMLMLRVKPSLPVLQKVQAMAQPTWVDRHWVMRVVPALSVLGISTVSTCSPSARRSRNLTVPSSLFRTREISGQTMRQRSASRTRTSFAISVMSSNARAFLRQIHCHIWSVRNLGRPSSPVTKASSSPKARSQILT